MYVYTHAYIQVWISMSAYVSICMYTHLLILNHQKKTKVIEIIQDRKDRWMDGGRANGLGHWTNCRSVNKPMKTDE